MYLYVRVAQGLFQIIAYPVHDWHVMVYYPIYRFRSIRFIIPAIVNCFSTCFCFRQLSCFPLFSFCYSFFHEPRSLLLPILLSLVCVFVPMIAGYVFPFVFVQGLSVQYVLLYPIAFYSFYRIGPLFNVPACCFVDRLRT